MTGSWTLQTVRNLGEYQSVAGMRVHRIMFSDQVWEMVQREAEMAGVSAAQFVREAAAAYAIWKLAKRGGDDFTDEIERIIAGLRSESS